MHKVMLHRLLTVMCLAIPAGAAAVPPRIGHPGATRAIQPVLTPLPERDRLLPIGLNCPIDHQNGVLEILWENLAGQRQSTRVTYRAGQMQILEILRAPVNDAFRSTFVMDLSHPNADLHEITTSLATAADQVRRDVCLGDAVARRQHQARMDANRGTLRTPR